MNELTHSSRAYLYLSKVLIQVLHFIIYGIPFHKANIHTEEAQEFAYPQMLTTNSYAFNTYTDSAGQIFAKLRGPNIEYIVA